MAIGRLVNGEWYKTFLEKKKGGGARSGRIGCCLVKKANVLFRKTSICPKFKSMV